MHKTNYDFRLLPIFFDDVNRVLHAGGAVMIVDSKPFRGEKPGEQLKPERVLNNGSRHQIVKVFHAPETLKALLEPFGIHVQTWTS